MKKLMGLVILIFFTLNSVYSQTSIHTGGVIIIDTIKFSGYIYCLKEYGRFMLSVDTLDYSSNEDRLKKGNVLYINPKYFNLLISEKSKLN